MVKLPSLTNATLTKVETAGFTSDYDQVATVGATKWSGTEEVYFSEVTDHVNAGAVWAGDAVERADVVVRRSVVVDSALPVTFAIGDIVTVTRDAVTEVGTVDRVTVTKATGLAGVTRLVLKNA